MNLRSHAFRAALGGLLFATSLVSGFPAAHAAPATAPKVQSNPLVPQIDDFLLSTARFQDLTGACRMRGWTAEDRSRRVYGHVDTRFLTNQAFYTAGEAPAGPLMPQYFGPLTGEGLHRNGVLAMSDSGRVVWIDRTFGSDAYEFYPEQNLIRLYAHGNGANVNAAVFRPDGSLIVADDDVLYRYETDGSPPVVIAGNKVAPPFVDSTALSTSILVNGQIIADSQGNIWFTESAHGRVRMLRANDNRIVTMVGTGGHLDPFSLTSPQGLALDEPNHALYIVDTGASMFFKVDLQTGARIPYSGTGGNIPTVASAAFAGGQLYVIGSDGAEGLYRVNANNVPQTLTAVAGLGDRFADYSQRTAGVEAALGTLQSLTQDASGGIFLTGIRPFVLRFDTGTGQLDYAGGHVLPLEMGTHAFWFGADMNSAPDEVANWINDAGYGNSWGQWLESPSISVSLTSLIQLTFDTNVGLADLSNENFAVYVQLADGTWTPANLDMTSAAPLAPALLFDTGGLRFARGSGVAKMGVYLPTQNPPLALGATTRFRIFTRTNTVDSPEDGPIVPGFETGVVIDNLHVLDAGVDMIAPVDFEDGTTGGWTAGARNFAADGATEVHFVDRGAPPASPDVRSNFDPAIPASCVWSFTDSPGDTVPEGVLARLTSPWIRRYTHNPLILNLSGKLATINQSRFVNVTIRGKNAGQPRPERYSYSNFLLTSGTSGPDAASPYFTRSLLDIDDFQQTLGFDSVQVVLDVQDRVRVGLPARTTSRLPYFDDIDVRELAPDNDYDGVPDVVDACPAVSAAGQDADGNGCLEPTATMRHVESWANHRLPIRFAISQTGLPGVSDGSDVAAVRGATQAWRGVPGARDVLQEAFPVPQVSASGTDGINLVTFQDPGTPFPPSVLAVTPTLSYDRTANYDDTVVAPFEIVDADIIVNGAASLRTPTHPGSYDLQSVLTHEFGHMLGLVHSGVSDATMYFVQLPSEDARSLESDDLSALAAAYPAADLQTGFGAIKGRVMRDTTGQGLPGALVTAVRLDGSGAPVDTVASDYTDEDGGFQIFRLPPGDYGVHIQALDGSVLDGMTPEFVSERLAFSAVTSFDPEWWNDTESAFDDPSASTPIVLAAGDAPFVTVTTNLDTLPPVVTSVSPASNVIDVGIDATVLVNFNDAVNSGTLGNAFKLRKTGNNGSVGGNGLLSHFGKTFVFTPTNPLEFSTSYELVLTTALTDLNGVHLDADFVTHFTTQAQPGVSITDIQPRTVLPGGTITLTGAGFDAVNPTNNILVSAPINDSIPTGFVTPTSLVAVVPVTFPPGPITLKVVRGPNLFVSNTFGIAVVAPAAQASPTASGNPIGVPFAPRDVALSSDGSMIFVAGDGGFATINLDPARAAAQPGQFPLRVAVQRLTGSAGRVVLSTDGTHAYVSLPDARAILDVNAVPGNAGFGTVLDTIEVSGQPFGLAVSPTGKRLWYTDHGLPQIGEVNVDPGSAGHDLEVRVFVTPFPPDGGITIDDAGRTLHYSTAGSGERLDLPSGISTAEGHGPNSGSVVLDLYGDRVYYTAGLLGLRRVGVLSFLATNLSTGGSPSDLARSPIGPSLFAVNSVTNRLMVINADSSSATFGAKIAEVATGSAPGAVAVNANGGTIAVANTGDLTVSIFAYGTNGAPTALRVVPAAGLAGERVAIQGDPVTSGFVAGTQVDLGSGTLFAAQNPQGQSAGFTVPSLSQRSTSAALQRPDGQRSLGLPFEIVDPINALGARVTGAQVNLVNNNCFSPGVFGYLRAVRLTPDGRRLVVIREACNVFDDVYAVSGDDISPFGFALATGTAIGGGDIIDDMAITPDGRNLWIASGELGAGIVDIATGSPTAGQRIGTVGVIPLGNPRTILADPLGRFMICGSHNGSGPNSNVVSLWPVNGVDAPLGAIAGTTNAFSLAATGDGRYLVAGGVNHTYFCDLGSRTILATSANRGTAGATYSSVAISRDGRRALGALSLPAAPAATPTSFTLWNLDPTAGAVGAELFNGIVPGVPSIAGGRVLPAADGTGFLLTLPGSPTLSLLEPVPGSLVMQTQLTLPAVPSAIVPSQDGRRLWVARSTTLTDADLTMMDASRATGMSVVSGGGQSGSNSSVLPLPVRVRVVTALGAPEPGVAVRFTLTSSQGFFAGGDLNVMVLLTNANGEAEVSWQLPASGSGAKTMGITALGVPGATLSVGADVVENDAAILPTVVELGPADGATGINAGGQAFVRFNQRMQPGAAAKAKLFANGQPVTVRATFSDAGRFMLLTPAAPLPFGAACSLQMESGALDTDGQALADGATSNFTIESPPALTFTTVSPPSGPEGATVVLTGEGFSPTPSLNTVRFNGLVSPVQSASLTSLVCEVPTSATSGPVTIEVGGVVSNPVSFFVLTGSGVGGALGDLPATSGIRDIAITPDGRRVYVTNPSLNTVSALQVAQAINLGNITVGLQPQGIILTPDGLRAYVANTGSNDVSVIDTDSLSATFNKELKKIRVGPGPIDVAVSGNFKVAVANSGDGTLSIIDADARNDATYDRVTTTVNCGAGAKGVAISADGTHAYVAVDGGLAIVDLIAQAVTTTIGCGSGGKAVAISPDNTLALVLTVIGDLKVIYLGEGNQHNQVVTTVKCGAGAQAVTVSADNTLAYVTLADGKTVLVFSVQMASGAPASSTVPGPPVVLTQVAQIPVGDNPAGMAADVSGQPRLFVANSGSGTVTVIGHPGGLPAVPVGLSFSPNTLNLKSNGRWVKCVIEPEPPLVADSIAISSIRLNGVVAVDPDAPHSIGDDDHDGRRDLMVKFLRHSVELVVPEGDHVPVTVTGRIANRDFSGRDTISVKRGHIVAPVPNQVVAPGTVFTVRWTTPNGVHVDHVQISHSFDGGANWIVDAGNLSNTGSYLWNVPLVAVDSARVAVVFVDHTLVGEGAPIDSLDGHGDDGGGSGDDDVAGVLAVSEPFRIFGVTSVEAAPTSLQFAGIRPNPAHGSLRLRFGLPRRADVELELFDVSGRRVRTLSRGTRAPGWYEIDWQGRDEAGGTVDAGLYFLRLRADGREIKQRLVWLR